MGNMHAQEVRRHDYLHQGRARRLLPEGDAVPCQGEVHGVRHGREYGIVPVVLGTPQGIKRKTLSMHAIRAINEHHHPYDHTGVGCLSGEASGRQYGSVRGVEDELLQPLLGRGGDRDPQYEVGEEKGAGGGQWCDNETKLDRSYIYHCLYLYIIY